MDILENIRAEQIQEAIDRLKKGIATKEDVVIVKAYLEFVEEMVHIFDTSVSTANEQENTKLV